jgi:hypothetical protein
VAAISLTVCFVRGICRFAKYLSPLVDIILDLIMVTLWYYSLANQISGDFSDRDHPSVRPWWTERSCSSVAGNAHEACQNAKACLCLVKIVLYVLR